MSVSDWESAVRIDLGVTNKLQQLGKFSNMESAHNEDGVNLFIVKVDHACCFCERTW